MLVVPLHLVTFHQDSRFLPDRYGDGLAGRKMWINLIPSTYHHLLGSDSIC